LKDSGKIKLGKHPKNQLFLSHPLDFIVEKLSSSLNPFPLAIA
jgi:hypothetical protein